MPAARHAGRTIKRIAVKGAFHGRTERPALYSDSSRKAYVQHLASFRDEDQPDHGRALRHRRAEAGLRRRRRQRLVHRGDVPGAGDGRRRSGPRRAAGVLRRRARTDQGARHAAAGRFHPGRPARARRAVDRRLPGLRRPGSAGHGNLFQGAQRRPVPAVGARGERARRRPVSQGRVRQHHDHQPARAGHRLRRARRADAGTARQHPRQGPGVRSPSSTS